MSPPAKLGEYKRKRDFTRTSEPAGGRATTRSGALSFVIQKHAASHLHFDLRLELDGVMKSWAVPKGPSLDPATKRLAMEVEDHPMEYNTFEGTIPKGEYGGGTVMLWDRGSYEPVGGGAEPQSDVRRAHREGRLDIIFHGERLRGAFALVRTRSAEEANAKPQWLLMKKDDADAGPARDIVAEVETSVESGRTMEEIARGTSRVWHSNRAAKPAIGAAARPSAPRTRLPALSPMLCEIGTETPTGKNWVFEPKLDGIRALAVVTPGAATLITRNGNDKSSQFPEVIAELRALSERLGYPFVLDGEIVAVDADGGFRRFEALQGRMHVQDAASIRRHRNSDPAVFVAFDLLLAEDDVLMGEAWTARRARLEALLKDAGESGIRLGEISRSGSEITRRAREEGWEGIIAKRTDSRYVPGARSRDWLKLKLENRQEFVVGGWTEPRNSRKHFGAILLGYYDPAGKLIYAGHTGTGFSGKTLDAMYARLAPLERKTPAFSVTPKTNEKAHWTTPRVVVEVKFNEWTSDGKLRHPSFVGIREDKDPRTVVREAPSQSVEKPVAKKAAARRKASKAADVAEDPIQSDPIACEVRRIEKEERGEGKIALGREQSLDVTSLGKVFFPLDGYTKGDLLAYYAGMAEHILPWMKDRPLVLKRFPNGIREEAFYQQSAGASLPGGVRAEAIRMAPGEEEQLRFVGGNLATLLYTIQLGAVSYDPWHSRVQAIGSADYTILDLDPGEGASFQRVVQVARWVKEEMDELGFTGALKTSGSRGLHIYLPLRPRTPLDAATLIAQIIATRVAQKHPVEATVERMVRKRPRGTVYVDYLQNILGKTIAGVYAVRAKDGATVSTPLRWEELDDDLDLHAFTIRSVPLRLREVGDLWTPAMSVSNSPELLLPKKKRQGAGR
ncbi:MAG: DNA ligase D [Gemmatimonadetes bacterium]|nr:DNA ligase D [Gemmatimonadota bacterium]